MDAKKLRILAKIMEETGLTALRIEEPELIIDMERAAAPAPALYSAEKPAAASIPARVVQETDTADFNDLTLIKAPMVGVFYDAPSPDAEPYVKKGGMVKKGDVLCIVEAMKVMNEITAEADGQVADICVTSGQVVEYGQTLIKLFK